MIFHSQISLKTPALSVLIPVKNGGRFLDQALESLAVQTFRDFEIILIDNGSSDETPETVARWAMKDTRIRAFSRPAMRLGACLQEAVSLARAPLIARLDADDLAAPNRFARQVEIMRAHPELIVVGSSADLIDAKGRGVGSIRHPTDDADIRSAMLLACPFVHSSVVMRTDVCRAAGGYRSGLNICEDYDLWSRMAELGTVANLTECLTSYRVHAGSLTSRQPARMAITAICVFAGARARRYGRPEPFIAGVPSLRAALAELGLPRDSARRMVRMRMIRHRLGRAYVMLPVPGRLKAIARAAAHQLGPRRLYLVLLHHLLGAPGDKAIPAPVRT